MSQPSDNPTSGTPTTPTPPDRAAPAAAPGAPPPADAGRGGDDGGAGRRGCARPWLPVGCLLAVVAVVLGVAVLLLALPRGPQHALIREQLIEFLRSQTDREIRVGDVYGSLARGITVTGLAIAEEGGFDVGTVAAVESLRLEYGLFGLVTGQVDPLASIQRIEVRQPEITIRREADKSWELLELIELPEPAEEKPTTFDAVVDVDGGRIVFLDSFVGTPDDPFRIEVEHVRTTLDFNGEEPADVRLHARAPGAVDEVTVEGELDLGTRVGFAGTVAVENLDSAAAIPYVNPLLAPHVRITSGRASAVGPLAFAMVEVENDPSTDEDDTARLDLGMKLTVRAVDIAGFARPVGEAVRDLDGTVIVQFANREGSPLADVDAVIMQDVTASVGESRVSVPRGSVVGFSDPVLDIRVDSRQLQLGELGDLLPEVKALRQLESRGTSAASLRISGDVDHLRIAGWARPDDVSWGDLGTVGSGLVRLDIQRTPPGDGVAGIKGWLDLTNVQASTRYLAAGLESLTGQVVLAANAVVFDNVRGRLGGAPVRVDGRVGLATDDEPMRFDLVAAAEGLDPTALAPVLPEALRPVDTDGVLTARVALAGPRNALSVEGRAVLPRFTTPQLVHLGGEYVFDLRLGDRPTGWVRLDSQGVAWRPRDIVLRDITGTVHLQPNALRVDSLRARLAGPGGGLIRAEGSLGYDLASFDLRVQTPGVSAERLLALAGRRDIRGAGQLAADLRVSGSLERFTVQGSASVPRLRVPGVDIARATARLDLTVVPDLGVRGLFGTVSVANAQFTADAIGMPVHVARGTVRFDGGRVALQPVVGSINGDAFTVRGTVAGLPGVSSLDLRVEAPSLDGATIRRLIGRSVLPELRIARPLAVDVRLTGNLRSLRVQGAVNAPRVVLAGEQPTTLGARASVDLRVRPGAAVPAVGTVRLRQAMVNTPALGLPVTDIEGVLRLGADGRIYVESPLTGEVGESRFVVRGSVGYTGPEPTLDLAVAFPRLQLDDVRGVLARLEAPPEFEGEGALRVAAIDVTGPLSRLRIATRQPIQLPDRLVYGDYIVQGGNVALDVVLADGSLERGTVRLGQSTVLVEPTGTRVAVQGALLRVSPRGIEQADLLAMVDGQPIRVAGVTDAQGRLGARVRVTDVPLFGLLPDLAEYRDLLGPGRVSSDLVVSGPLDDLAIAGRVAFGGGELDFEPLQANVHVRLVQPGDAERVVLGGIELVGGAVRLPLFDEPIGGLQGSVEFAGRNLVLNDLSAQVAGQTIGFDGVVQMQPEMIFDLTLGLDGVNPGAVLAALRLPAEDGETRVDAFTRFDIPRLQTPQPLQGTIEIVGPREQVAVAVDLRLPEVRVPPEAAVADALGLGAQADSPAGLLARDLFLHGTATGALPGAVEALPDGEELAAALLRLVKSKPAGLELAAAEPHQLDLDTLLAQAQPEPEPEPADQESLLEAFTLGLRLDIGYVDPRQALAFVDAEVLDGPAGTFFAYEPARVGVWALGPAARPEVRASMTLGRFEVEGFPVRGAVANADWFGEVVTVSNLSVDVRGGQVTGSGAATLRPGEPIDGFARLDLDDFDLALLNALDTPPFDRTEVGGLAAGEVQLHLANETPRVQAALTLDQLTIDEELIGDAVAEVGLAEDLLVVRRLELVDRVHEAYARARGRVRLVEAGAVDLVYEVRSLELARVAPLLPAAQGSDGDVPMVTGRLDITGAVAGTTRFPLVTGAGNVFFGSLNGYPFNRLTFFSRQTGPDSVVAEIELSDPAYRADAEAVLDDVDFETGEADYRVAFDVERINLGQLLPLVNPALEDSRGRVVGQGRLTGRIAQVTEPGGETRLNPLADLAGRVELNAGDPEQPQRLRIAGVRLDTAELTAVADGEEVVFEALEINVGETRIGLDPDYANRIVDLDDTPELDVRIVSDQLRYEDIEPIVGVPLETTGFVTLTADVEGPLRAPEATIAVETHDVSIFGEEIENRRIAVRVGPDQIAILGGPERFELFGSELVLAGEQVGERLAAEVRFAITDFDEFRSWLERLTRPIEDNARQPWQRRLDNLLASIPEPVDGRFEAAVRVAGVGHNRVGFLRVVGEDLVATPVVTRTNPRTGRPQQVRVTQPLPDLRVDVNIGPTPSARPIEEEAHTVYVFGRVNLPNGDPGEIALQMTTGRIQLARYEAWSPALDGLRGLLTAQLSVGGDFRSPDVLLDRLAIDGVGLGDLRFAQFSIDDLSWVDERLDLGTIRLADRSLEAVATGSLPIITVSGDVPADGMAQNVGDGVMVVPFGGVALEMRARAPMEAAFDAEVAELGEFAHLMGSVGALEGQADVEFRLGGTPARPVADGRITSRIPRLQIVESVAEQVALAPEEIDLRSILSGDSPVAPAPGPSGEPLPGTPGAVIDDAALDPVEEGDDEGVVVDVEPAPEPDMELPTPADQEPTRGPADAPAQGPIDGDDAAVPAAPPREVVGLYDLRDIVVDLRIDDNSLVVEEFAARSFPPDPTAAGAGPGTLRIEPGSSVTLRYTDADRLLMNPVDMRLIAENLSFRQDYFAVTRMDLDVAIEPVFSGGVLSRLTVNEGQAWVNGGYVRLDGELAIRHADLARWQTNDYRLTLSTPVVQPDGLEVPSWASSPVAREGGLVYPIRLVLPGIAESLSTLDLALETREGQTPPLTLAGEIHLLGSEIREGVLALLARGGGGDTAAALPAFPRLDIALVATENNWIRSRVPSFEAPWQTTLRVSGTPQALRVDGDVDVGRGQLTASVLAAPIRLIDANAHISLRRDPSTGQFSPFVDLQADAETTLRLQDERGRYQSYQVNLDVDGTVRPGQVKPIDTDFLVRATSNPSLPEERIFAALSRTSEFAAALQSGSLEGFLRDELANAAVQTALAYALAPVFDELREALGLDILNVRIELERPIELQVGSYLVDNLLLTFTLEVGGDTGTRQTISLAYDIGRGFRVGAEVNSESEFRVTAQWNIRF